MTFIQRSEKEVADIRKRQAEFKKCVDKFFDEAVTHVLNERFLKQSFCTHPDLIETKSEDGGEKKCPECGWWCAWGIQRPYVEPPPYKHEGDIEDLLRSLRIV